MLLFLIKSNFIDTSVYMQPFKQVKQKSLPTHLNLLKYSSIQMESDQIVPIASYGKDVVKESSERRFNEEEAAIFDWNMKFGPCIGLTRSERWNRAKKLGLNPPLFS